MSNSAPPRDAASVIAQEFIVDEPCTIAVDIPGAHTRLRPGPASDRVEVNVAVTGCSPDEAEDILDRMQVGTHQMKDAIRVYSDGDRSDAVWWRWIRTLDVTIHVELKLPSTVEADLRVPGGEVDVANLEGEFEITAMGGRCRAHDLEGALTLRGDSAEASIKRFSGSKLDAHVAAGTLTLDQIDAETVSVHSVCSPVHMSDVTSDTSLTANGTTVDVEDVSGPFSARIQGGTLSFDAAPRNNVDLTSVGASIHVTLPSDHEADVDIRGETVEVADVFSFSGEQTNGHLEGIFNGGGPPLSLRAIRGNVTCKAA